MALHRSEVMDENLNLRLTLRPRDAQYLNPHAVEYDTM